MDDHGEVARNAAHQEEAVEEYERVHTGEGKTEVRPSQVHGLVGVGMKLVDDLRQELVEGILPFFGDMMQNTS